MPQLPLLVFPRSLPDVRDPLNRAILPKLIKPTAEEQRRRLGEKFTHIVDSFSDGHSNQDGIEPEQVIVFEVIGTSIPNLAKAATKIPNLEWLAECEREDIAPVAGFYLEDADDEQLKYRMYAVMSNQRAMQELLGLWGDWDPAVRAKKNFGPFKELFSHLLDIRRWNYKDRLEEARILEYWQQDLENSPEMMRFEIEFWFRSSDAQRATIYQELERAIVAEGGRCIDESVIPEILYHGVLVELPAQKIRQFIQQLDQMQVPALFRYESIMLFRPEAQTAFPLIIDDAAAESFNFPASGPAPMGEPIIALLDGVPLANHQQLSGRIIVDDPENFESRYPLDQRQHGTAIAGLVIHGDINAAEPALKRPVYLRPIFEPVSNFNGGIDERTPGDRLLVDLIHAAVRRIKVGSNSEAAVAPHIQVINLSLGNSHQPFDRTLSPLAKLLDWLSWTYNVLFIVSSGNQKQQIKLEPTNFNLANSDSRTDAVLNAVWNDQRNRRVFSPSEAVNALCVGALHSDNSTPVLTAMRVDLLNSMLLPSPICTVCHGFRHAMKPDILFPGGRQTYQNLGVSNEYQISTSNQAPGNRVCVPTRSALVLDGTTYTRGSSNAAAIASRSCGLLSENLEELRSEPGGERLREEFFPVILKTLLVHGASWGEAADIIDRAFSGQNLNWHELQRRKSRLLGFGAVDISKSMQCEDHRVTVLGWDFISREQGHSFKIPLPPSLSGRAEKRRLTITLAWFTPINPQHSEYRRASLWFDLSQEQRDKLNLGISDLDQHASKRGSVQHRIFEGDRAQPVVDGDFIEFSVNCRELAGVLDVPVPYAIAATLELAEPSNIPIYEEVRDRIRTPVTVSASTSS